VSTRYAPDGSPVALYALLGPGRELDIITSVLPPAASILELGCGAGRITHPLVERGHAVTAVDNSPDMLAHVRGAATVLADIEALDLRREFDAVLLASNMVHDDAGDAFLATGARHVRPGGTVLVERHAPEWVRTAEPSRTERDGVLFELRDVSHAGDELRATMRYTAGDDTWEHAFTVTAIDDDDLRARLARAGLTFRRFLDEGREWVEATR
jgi:SAM-dependent methyltransferase